MNTKVIAADEAGIKEAVAVVAGGELAVLPTETVYGICADASSDEAVQKVFTAKGRPQDNPLIVHVGSDEQVLSVVSEYSAKARMLAKAFWPGPLTMIMPKGNNLCKTVTAGLDSVGIRMPSHPVIREYFRLGGVPFAAPSANLSGSPSPTNAADVLHDMNGRLPLILDGGECEVGVESTVVSMLEEKAVILRPGYVTKEQMEAVLGEEVKLSHAVTEKLKDGETARSPGMKYKHYAPKAEVTIVKGSFEAYASYVAEHALPGVWALCFKGEEDKLPVPCVAYGEYLNEAAQAHDLFTSLRVLDEQGAQTVYARCPRTEGIGMAVYNRLIRAAAFRVIEV